MILRLSKFSVLKKQKHSVHFINDIMTFEGLQKIHKIKFLKTSQDPDVFYQKQSLVDVLCTDEKGHQYIIKGVYAITGRDKNTLEALCA